MIEKKGKHLKNPGDMKVEVIKGASHSIELIHGETSVCITPDEAENLIAQLRAVVPVPSDVQEAAKQYASEQTPVEYPNLYGEDAIKSAYAAGMLDERERMMKEAVQGEVVHINGFPTLENVVLPSEFLRVQSGSKVKLIILKEDEK